MIHAPNSVLLDFALWGKQITIHWYGVLYCLAFLVGYAIGSYLVSRYYLSQLNYTKQQKEEILSSIFDWALISFIGGIIGARLWFVVLQWDYFAVNPLEIPQIWLGGQSIQGGIIGGVLTAYIYYLFNRAKLIPFRQMLDYAAITLPVSQAIGRFGNFFNIEAFGQPTNLPWALYVPAHLRPANYLEYSGFHPTFFYEAIFLFITAFLLLYFYNKFLKERLVPGSLFIIYLIFYSIGRFFLEYLRLDSLLIIGIPAAQVICLITIIISSIILWRININK